MKLNDFTVLEEAIRFDSQAMALIQQMAPNVLIGIEYEYHVNESGINDGDAITQDEFDRLVDEMADRSRDSYIEQEIEYYLDRQVDTYAPVIDKFNAAVEKFKENNTSVDDLKNEYNALNEKDELDDSDVMELANVINEIHDYIQFIEGLVESFDTDELNYLYDVGINLELDPTKLPRIDTTQSVDDIRQELRDKKRYYATIINHFFTIDTSGEFSKTLDDDDLRKRLHEDAETYANNAWDENGAQDARNEAEDQVHGDYNVIGDNINDEMVDFIEKELDDKDNEWGIDSSLIDSVVNDRSVFGGVEVITKALPMNQAFDLMNKMFNHIKDMGSTSNSTGMHVNISIKGLQFTPQTFNPVKLFILLDEAFLRSSDTTKPIKIIKYPLRKYVELISAPITVNDIFDIAKLWTQNSNIGQIESMTRKLLVKSGISAKYQSINFNHVFDAEVDNRRIEFRYFGGKDYETRYDEMSQDIQHAAYALNAAFDPAFARKLYLKGLVKFFDKILTDPDKRVGWDGSTPISFSEMVSRIKTYKYDDLNSMIHDLRARAGKLGISRPLPTDKSS